jgi:S1-C subfamily serine protease
MIAELRFRTGALAGHVTRFKPGDVTIGRAPGSTLRFPAHEDLDVSGAHALLFFHEGGWNIRDVGSRNGTFVNGVRTVGSVRLRSGDGIHFGPNGPLVELRIVGDMGTAGRVLPAGAAVAAGLLALALLGAGAWLLSGSRQEAETPAAWVAEREALLARIDTLRLRRDNGDALEVERAQLEAERAALAEARREAESRVTNRRRQLAAAEAAGSGEEVTLLRRQVQEAETALTRQQLAATLDADAVTRASRNAVAMLYVEEQDGSVRTGTGFAVRSDGTIITARHLFEVAAAPAPGAGTVGEAALAAARQRIRRLGVQFAYSDQVWPARILALDPQYDIAAVKVDNILGAVPTITGFNLRGDTLAGGRPVAMVGFPLGGSPRADGSADVVRPVISVGVMLRADSHGMEIQGYGASGASGSPVLDGDGRVIAVMFGGRRDVDGQLLVAVPALRVVQMLERIRGTPP